MWCANKSDYFKIKIKIGHTLQLINKKGEYTTILTIGYMAIMGGACLILGKGESSSFKIFFIGAFGCLAMALCMPKFGGKATIVV